MNRYRQKDLEIPGPAAALVPRAMIEEAGWDILLALHSDRRGELSLEKLASMASLHQTVMGSWLSWLEDRSLVTGTTDKFTGQLRAVLTPRGRDLLDRYLSAVGDLQSGNTY